MRIVDSGWVNIRSPTVVISWPKFTKFFLLNGEGSMLDNAFFRLSIAPQIPEIFAVKVKLCHKLRRILDVFALRNLKKRPPPKKKLYTRYHPHLMAHHVVKFRNRVFTRSSKRPANLCKLTANVRQTSSISTCILHTFAGSLLDVCWIV